ncbi:MAG TPA: alpha/beta hydrolase [Candidatus Angelobacter sp.]|nr:alpha/beta hydrolase [Candidatus Angelobacter sp.]
MFFLITNRTVNANGWTSDRNPNSNTFWSNLGQPLSPFSNWKMADREECLALISGIGKPPLVWIHGFNNSPEKALGTLQAIAAGLGDSFTYIAYLWPSQAREDLIGYQEDSKTVEASAPQILDALKLFDNPTVIAHSRGNYAIQKALYQEWTQSAEKVIGAFISVAADVDNDILAQVGGQGLKNLVERALVLLTPKDGALIASAEIHLGRLRLGLTGPDGPCPGNFVKQDCTELMKIDNVELWLNHSAYFQSPKVYELVGQFLGGQAKAVGA